MTNYNVCIYMNVCVFMTNVCIYMNVCVFMTNVCIYMNVCICIHIDVKGYKATLLRDMLAAEKEGLFKEASEESEED